MRTSGGSWGARTAEKDDAVAGEEVARDVVVERRAA